jgi:hypothetical protein
MTAPAEPPGPAPNHLAGKIPGGNDGRSSYFGRAERLLGAAAVLGAAIYALLNVLYVEFYDDFGVRPEEVGWDRLTMLSRTAWVVLAVLIGTVLFLLGKALLGSLLTRETTAPAKVFAENPVFMWFAVVLVIVLAGYWYLTVVMEREADRVARGETANGVGLFVPFIDVRAYRADATWIGEAERRPTGLDSPHLTYLGR